MMLIIQYSLLKTSVHDEIEGAQGNIQWIKSKNHLFRWVIEPSIIKLKSYFYDHDEKDKYFDEKDFKKIQLKIFYYYYFKPNFVSTLIKLLYFLYVF